MSNHDFGRLATRFGDENARSARASPAHASRSRLPLPGGRDRPGGGAGRRETIRPRRARPLSPPHAVGRHPGGWLHHRGRLPVIDPQTTNVDAQRNVPGSTLSLVRDLIRARRDLDGNVEMLDAAPGVLAYRRGEHGVAINTTAEPQPAPPVGESLIETHAGASVRDGALAPHAGRSRHQPATAGGGFRPSRERSAASEPAPAWAGRSRRRGARTAAPPLCGRGRSIRCDHGHPRLQRVGQGEVADPHHRQLLLTPLGLERVHGSARDQILARQGRADRPGRAGPGWH